MLVMEEEEEGGASMVMVVLVAADRRNAGLEDDRIGAWYTKECAPCPAKRRIKADVNRNGLIVMIEKRLFTLVADEIILSE